MNRELPAVPTPDLLMEILRRVQPQRGPYRAMWTYPVDHYVVRVPGPDGSHACDIYVDSALAPGVASEE